MQRLSKQLLIDRKHNRSTVQEDKIETYRERIVQFGEGNFLRAFADWMIHRLNQNGLFDGCVVVVQPLPQGQVDDLNEQDGLYTLLLRGYENGQYVEHREIVSSISRGIDPYRDWESVLECARMSSIRFLVSNTTEAGIAYAPEPYDGSNTLQSFPAKVTAFLYERFVHFQGAPDKGLIVLPCELIERNGETLQSIVSRIATDWKLGDDFQAWLKNSCCFYNTLVDRIVPGYPENEAERLFQELGYRDTLLVAGEFYHQWILEGPPRILDELPFAEAGLNVIGTNDLTPYRTRKVRILNGVHTGIVAAAYLSGMDTVGKVLQDDVLNHFLSKMVYDEIIPSMSMDADELAHYADAVLERFRNPSICHELLSIALNTIDKWKVRVMPSLIGYVKRRQTIPPLLSFSLAATLSFYRCVRSDGMAFFGKRNGTEYPIHDNPKYIEAISQAWSAFQHDRAYRWFAVSILSNTHLWDCDLTQVTGLVETVAHHIEVVETHGMRNAVESIFV